VGTEITLEVHKLTVDWSKNARGADHGALFQAQDRKRTRSDQIDYEYFKERGEDPGAMEMAFSRLLRQVLPRLELLGFTLEQVKREYLARANVWREEQLSMVEGAEESVPEAMSFEEFRAFAVAHPLQSLDDTPVYDIDAESEKRIRGRFRDETFIARLPHSSIDESSAYSERSYFGNLIGFLHPYSILRLLAENSLNLDADVVWGYGPLVDAGWAVESEFTPGARRSQTFLVATEGSSDAHILKHALALLVPEIEDFFRFIDVSERHPFPGTGNLLKFAEGLAKIDVHNQIIFLFDNDAEGFDTYQRLLKLTLPANMRAMMLPELEDFRSFPALGPDGVKCADINRRGAAIECYLDLQRSGGQPPVKVIWTNYKKELGAYHGALEHKEGYAKAFLKQTAKTVSAGSYDVRKLRLVLDSLISECSSMASLG
jgi:hypothetical protein